MKQTREDLLRLISSDPEHPLDLSDVKIDTAVPRSVGDRDRNFLMLRFGLHGMDSMSYPKIAALYRVSPGSVRVSVTKTIGLLRLRMNTGISSITRDTPILLMDFSSRTLNCLKSDGVERLGDLEGRLESDLLAIRGFGQKCLEEVRFAAETVGIKLTRDLEAAPATPISEIGLCKRSMRLIRETDAHTLADLARLVSRYNPDSPLWKVGNQDLGILLRYLAAAGLLVSLDRLRIRD